MTGLLLRMLNLLPTQFRRRFGAEMAEQIERDAERIRGRSLLVRLRFFCSVAADLLWTALIERVRPALESPPIASTSLRRPRRTLMDAVLNDFRLAGRSLLQSPGFTAAAVLTLGLAIGVNTGIFSVVDTVLLDPLPIREADRLVYVAGAAPGSDLPDEFPLSMEFLLHYDEHARSLEDISTYNWFTSTLRADGRVERVPMSAPTTSFFRTLGVDPLMGRTFDETDGDDVAVISHQLWTSWLGSDPDVLGKRYDISGEQRTVIGVMPEEFWFARDDVLVWLNARIDPARVRPGRFGRRMVARLAPGATVATLEAELKQLAAQLPERYEGSARYAELIERFQPVVRPIERELLGGAADALWLLFGAVVLVLLIACANVSNLLLVRTERRHADLAVRQAIGASRAQLLRLQMSEASFLALMGGVLAVGFAWLTVPLLIGAAPAQVPRLDNASIDGRTLGFAFVAALLAALLCGVFPAIKGSRPQLLRLREGGRGLAGHWGRNSLVVAQTALALVLLIGSGLLVRSLWQLRQVDPGYDLEDLFTFQIAPEGAALTDAASYARFHTEFMERISALPGVESVGLVENVPLNEGVSGNRFVAEGESPDAEGTRLSYTWSGGDYFRTAGIDLLAGRPFGPADHTTDLGNVVLSRTAAERLFPGQDPIGRRIRPNNQDEWETVVGVVEDVLQYDFRGDPEPLVYFSLVGQTEDPRTLSSPAYVVRTDRASEIGPEIRALVDRWAPNAPMYRTFTMEELAAGSMAGLSFSMLTLAVAAGLALLLGALGLYGVLSFVVAERTREIGLRMAMGAGPLRVRGMVVAQGFRIVAIGLVLGLVAALGAARLLDGMLYRTGATDPLTFASMTVAMVVTALLAIYLPAHRASRVDPMVSLRSE